jgi:hypothetical protein
MDYARFFVYQARIVRARPFANMSLVPPPIRRLAKQILAYEHEANSSSVPPSHLEFRVIEKLNFYFVALMGSYAYRVVLSRALATASEEVPWLSKISVNQDRMLEGWSELEKSMAPDVLFEGRVVLLARLLEFLITFVGETMTLRMLRDVWPKVSAQDLTFKPEDPNEK